MSTIRIKLAIATRKIFIDNKGEFYTLSIYGHLIFSAQGTNKANNDG